MEVDVAPSPREIQLLLGGDVLIPEEDDKVLKESGPDLGEGVLVDLRQIDPVHLGPQRTRNRLHFNAAILRHGVSPEPFPRATIGRPGAVGKRTPYTSRCSSQIIPIVTMPAQKTSEMKCPPAAIRT